MVKIDTDDSIKRCPHCGNILHNDKFIDSNYFKLLDNYQKVSNSNPSGTSRTNINATSHSLDNKLFTQGYFEKFFNELSVIGRGANSTVYKVEHVLNNISLGNFALKKITIGEDLNWLVKVLKEVKLLCTISCDNDHLVSYNHVWLEIDSINEFGPKIPCAFILQQYCSGGNLENFVKLLQKPILLFDDLEFKDSLSLKQKKQFIKTCKGRMLTNEEIYLILRDIVIGVNQLHKNHIIHRDLKPSNCLLNNDYFNSIDFSTLKAPNLASLPKVLIGDFGESQFEGEKRIGSGSTGTIEYIAPELIENNDVEFNKKTDMYSIGLILYFISFGELPFSNSTDYRINELKQEIIELDCRKLRNRRSDLNDDIFDIIVNLLSKDPSKRMDCDQVLKFLDSAATSTATGAASVVKNNKTKIKVLPKASKKRRKFPIDTNTSINYLIVLLLGVLIGNLTLNYYLILLLLLLLIIKYCY